MSIDRSADLVRLIIRLPRPVYTTLRMHAQTTAVPMSTLVRQLVGKWASEQPSRDESPRVRPTDCADPGVNG